MLLHCTLFGFVIEIKYDDDDDDTNTDHNVVVADSHASQICTGKTSNMLLTGVSINCT